MWEQTRQSTAIGVRFDLPGKGGDDLLLELRRNHCEYGGARHWLGDLDEDPEGFRLVADAGRAVDPEPSAGCQGVERVVDRFDLDRFQRHLGDAQRSRDDVLELVGRRFCRTQIRKTMHVALQE